MENASNQLVREEHESYWLQPMTFRVAESFEEFVALNPDLMVEQNRHGEIVIVSPVGSDGSSREIEIYYQLQGWTRIKSGKAFSSSVLFTLPDGSKGGPDASWIATARWETLSNEERESFAPICPDFVIELRSRSDRLKELQLKMVDYLSNGVRLGWQIDPFVRQAFIYRQNREVEVLDHPTSISGEDVLPGFELILSTIWAT
jgi:Uma2 family endonuclease